MEFSRYGLLNRRSGLQAIMNRYGQYVRGWWRFSQASGNLPDELGVNTLTVAGTPLFQQADYLGLGRAITFDGSTDYFSITDAAQTGLDLNGAEILADGGLEAWTGNNPDNWTKTEAGVSTVTDEGVEKHGGSHSAKLTIDVGNNEASIKQSKTVEVSTQYTLEVWRKHSAAAKTLKLVVRNTTTGNYLQSNGTWGATAGFEITNVVAWTKYVFPGQFITESSGTTLEIKVMNGTAASSSIYVDDISLTKCYDAVVLAVAKTSASGADQLLWAKSYQYWGRVHPGNDKFYLQLYDATTEKTTPSDSTVNDGNFKLFQGNYNRRGNLTMYINGSAQASPTDCTAVGNVDNALAFHVSAKNGPEKYWDGSIAEVMILTGAPLPAAVLSAGFANFAYKQALWYPLNRPNALGENPIGFEPKNFKRIIN